MAKDFARMEDSNPSANPTIHEVSDPKRRMLVQGGLAAAIAGLFGPLAGCAATGGTAGSLGRAIGFKSVPMAAVDTVVVPEGYSTQVLYRWGDATGIAGAMPAFKTDGSNTAEEQALQAGMHHDGMAFFPIDGSNRGLLVLNHEYVDDGLLHTDGMKTWTPEKVRKSMNAHGVSVIELQRDGGKWTQLAPSRFARRITALTPMTLTGPAAGHAMLRTAADPSGTQVLGTFNNCSNGHTPWGTYLTCEENFADYFEGTDTPDAHQKRWGIRKGNGAKYRWHEHEARFDVSKNPNESNRYGWVVEIDPQDPTSTPRKRTALGRAAHEGAATALTNDGRAVIYMGEDSRFEYIYKFVSRDSVKPGGAAANRDLLDHGTLYVGRFDVDGTGEWPGGRQGLHHARRRAHQGTPGQRPAGRHQDGPPRVDHRRPAHQGGLLHADQQQQPRRRRPALHGRGQSALQQHDGPDHPLEGNRRPRRNQVRLEPPRARGRPEADAL
jgi:secreted PhoX family phosphatase